LTKLIDDVFLKTCINALALKQRIGDWLHQRKFELENLERAYRKTMNYLKLEKHAQNQIRRKEPGLCVATVSARNDIKCSFRHYVVS